MCILFVAVNEHKDYPLIIAANRDEFFKRPTSESHFWPNSPTVLAGKDLQAGGTWMGINESGYLASLTNIRAPETIKTGTISRGELVSQYLHQYPSVTSFHEQLSASRKQYNGYNLLFGHWDNLAVYNNHTNQLQQLSSGFYGLSNAELNSPWPKINKGVNRLEQICSSNKDIIPKQLFDILLDTSQAEDEKLPKTGVPIEWERQLSSIFIRSKNYGTRSSTLLTINQSQHVNWFERTYDEQANLRSEKNYHFSMK